MYSSQSWPSGTCCETQSIAVGLHAAEPVRLEAENVEVELVRGIAAVDAHADVDNAVADGVRSGHREGSRRGLHESHDVALRVLDVKPQAAVGAVFDARGHLDLVRGKIFAQRLGVGGDVGKMVEAGSGVSGRQRQDLDKLRRIHIVADAVGVLRVRGLEQADIVDVILLGCLGMAGVDGDVRDAGDWRPRLGNGGQRQETRRDSGEDDSDVSRHRA